MGFLLGRRDSTSVDVVEQRATNLPQLIDDATGNRRHLGGSPIPVGWGGALAIPAVWAACMLRAEVLGSLPVGVYRTRPDGTTQNVGRTPTVLDQPSADFRIDEWLQASQLSLDLRGNAYGKIVSRDPVTYLPSQVELVHPDDVQVRTERDGSIVYLFGGRHVDTFDVWHERANVIPGSPVGLSPISAAARALGINLAGMNYGLGFFTEAIHPGGLLTSESYLDEEDAKTAKRRAIAAQQGREPLVLGGNWKWQDMTVSPEDAAYLSVMRAGAEDVARLFRVPGELIGAPATGSSVTYANREQRWQDLLALYLGPMIARREAALSRLTVRGQYVKLNTGGLLRADLSTRLKAYQIGTSVGAYTLDEVRTLEDREPLTPAELAALKDAGLLGKAAPAATVDADGNTTPIPATNGVPA